MTYIAGSIVICIVLIEIAGMCQKSYLFVGNSFSEQVKYFLNPAAAFLLRYIKKTAKCLGVEKNRLSDDYYEKIYVGEDCERAKSRCEERLVAIILGILLFVSLIVLISKVSGSYDSEYVKSIRRPERGIQELDVTALYGDNCYELDFSIYETYPSHKQMLERISAVKEKLANYILGENRSLDAVKSDLNLRETYTDESVKVEWSSSDTALVHSDGRVENENLISDRSINLTAVLVCFEESETVEFVVTIKPVSDAAAGKALLIQTIEELLEDTKKEEMVVLPEEVGGQKVDFIRQKEDVSGKIMILGIIASFFIIVMWYENRRTKLKERDNELMHDYPDVLSKFVMLMEAGLAIRKAFERIAIDYEKRKKGRRRRYVYEEMLKTRNELLLGSSEIEAYEAFGRRCGNIFYIRFASLLAQSVKRGSDSLMPHLHKEISEAMKEKQQAAKKKGEEVSLKLLLPMMGMFSLVLAIILIPAFLSM